MMAAGLRATAKVVEHPPAPKVGAPALDPTPEPISYFVGGGALKRVKLAACIFQEPLSRFNT
jgi:hypothetical protein